MWPSKQTLLGTIFVSSFVIIGSGASSDEDRANVSGTSQVVRDVKAIKAALETLKTRLSDVEFDALQRVDEMEAIHEEIAAIRNRVGQTLKSSPDVNVTSTPSRGTYSSLSSDVTTTGAVGRAAASMGQGAPPVAQVTPRVATAVETQQLVKADGLVRQGDIVGARLLLEHALRGGNPLVAFKLAETYDPGRLIAWRVIGVRGDAQKARELYQQAYAGGVQQARERVADLRN
jgi:hypothetical protein